MGSIGRALWQKIHSTPSDWAFLGILFAIGLILVSLGLWLQFRNANSTDQKLRELESKIPSITVNGILANLPKTEDQNWESKLAESEKKVLRLEAELAELTKPKGPLRDWVFSMCSELSQYTSALGNRPSEDELWNKYGRDGHEFTAKYNEQIQPWDNKSGAGYWRRFRDEIINLRHELAESNIVDAELDKALAMLDKPPDRTFRSWLDKLTQRMRYAASLIPDDGAPPKEVSGAKGPSVYRGPISDQEF